MKTAESCYADAARQVRVPIIENLRVAKDTYRLRVACPEIASRVVPGQFLMLRLSHQDDPLIGRPLAIYDVIASECGDFNLVDVVYVVGGKLTTRLKSCGSGQEVDIWGPLGNGFPPQLTDHLIMVAGGIGQTPFVMLAKEALGIQTFGSPSRTAPKLPRVTLCYGARSADYLAGVDDFRTLGVDVRISTDDGTAGRAGLVTQLLEDTLREVAAKNCQVVCCGPEPMMRAVAQLTRRCAISTQVSLETPMACGIGICFSCVAEVYDERGEADYRRTCVEGPVFDAQRIKWT